MRKPATLKEKLYISAAKSLGCAVADGTCRGGPEFHHMTKNGRRLGHSFGFCLCNGHHQSNKISIGHGVKTFEAKYGSQEMILRRVCKQLGVKPPEYKTKIVARRYAQD